MEAVKSWRNVAARERIGVTVGRVRENFGVMAWESSGRKEVCVAGLEIESRVERIEMGEKQKSVHFVHNICTDCGVCERGFFSVWPIKILKTWVIF